MRSSTRVPLCLLGPKAASAHPLLTQRGVAKGATPWTAPRPAQPAMILPRFFFNQINASFIFMCCQTFQSFESFYRLLKPLSMQST